ncbi:MAG TPA: hypothetical protein VK961_25145 [Chthoniobacter sp.]|nr:hypothetical protein [Chthoniobacter sp.]
MKHFSLVLAALGIMAFAPRISAQTPAPPATPKPLGETEVKRSGKYYVQFFLEENFKGRAYRVPVPAELINDAELKKLGIPNDSIQSMKIPEGVTVTLYDAAGYGGKNKTYTGNVPKLDEMRSMTSSLKAQLPAKQ